MATTFWTLNTKNRTKLFLIHHLPACAYAALIYYISSLSKVNPPSLGFAWEDKIYHFGEYFLFSILIYLALRFYRNLFIKKYIHAIAVFFGCLFAVTDEIHQYYIPGRDSTPGDLLADCLGVISAQILVWIFIRFAFKKGLTK